MSLKSRMQAGICNFLSIAQETFQMLLSTVQEKSGPSCALTISFLVETLAQNISFEGWIPRTHWST